MSCSVEEDNIKHLQRFKNEPPHPAYIAGLIDGDGCIFIRKIKNGYQTGISIAQSRTNILQVIRYHFGGSITTSANRNNHLEDMKDEDTNYSKYAKRNQYNLLIRSNEYQVILDYIKDALILKKEQMNCLCEFSVLANRLNKNTEKESLYQRYCGIMKNSIADTVKIALNIELSIEYIQGLFDAEGCVYLDKQKPSKFYMSITQKTYPYILHKIKDFLGFGYIEGNIVYKIFKKSDCLEFIALIKEKLIVKYNQVLAFETFLQAENKTIKEEMHKICYKICNEEKHRIENFTLLNQQNENKNGYLETMRLREIKNKVCKELLRRTMYKEKSEKMKGEGNPNFGKEKSEETKLKMSIAIRNAKNGISDETIQEVRKLLDAKKTIKEIQELLNLQRYTISDIKNRKLICRTEVKEEKYCVSQEEQNIKRRKIKIHEILEIIEKTIVEHKMPLCILNELNAKRQANNNGLMAIDLTIDIIKNIRKNILLNKVPFYEIEFLAEPEKYIYYKNMIDKNYKNINTS
jgi:hypothetical protein